MDAKTKYFSTTVTDEENAMIEELSSLTGLNKATAVKLHLRQTLPAKLAALRAELTGPSDADDNDTKNDTTCQG